MDEKNRVTIGLVPLNVERSSGLALVDIRFTSKHEHRVLYKILLG